MSDANLNEINGVPLYKPSDPYHYDFDNKPIKTLVERDNLILGVVNVLKSIIERAGGDLGSLPMRLEQSIDPEGNIKPQAVDEVGHNIASHVDGRIQISQQEVDYYTSLGYAVTDNPKFVRYLEEERAKLSLISDEANHLFVSVSEEDSSKKVIDNGEINFQSSDTIGVLIDDNNVIKFNSKFPISVAHQHYYQVEPYTEDNINYSISGIPLFREGSLRVYINGFRIEECSQDCENKSFGYYPSFTSSTEVQWKNIHYTENFSSASFSLSIAINENDKILVDYDVVLV